MSVAPALEPQYDPASAIMASRSKAFTLCKTHAKLDHLSPCQHGPIAGDTGWLLPSLPPVKRAKDETTIA